MTGAQASQRWLFSPFPDLFLGCGLIYCVAFLGLAFAGPQMRGFLPLELTPLVVLVTGIPHYGATLLRVYEHREDRRRYAVFGVFATLLVWGAFAVGVYQFAVGSVLLTLYLTWSPWHYSGQNYGIAVMFLRRRGVTVTSLSKRLLQWSFVLSFVLTFLAFHGPAPDVAYAPGEYQRSVYSPISLGILLGVPHEVVQVLIPVCVGAYLACLGGAAVCFRRVASWRDLFPTALLTASQALWFTIPLLARHVGVLGGFEPFGTEHTVYAFLWVAVAHATQYVWITSYYARRSPTPPSHAGYLLRTLLAGAAIWVVPSLIFAPGVLGRVPYDAGLGVLVAAAVNIHHFVLDGAIWKLRDGRIAKILLRGQSETDEVKQPSPRLAWSIWAVGGVSAGILLMSPLEQKFGLAEATARGDLQRAETAQRRLLWMGRESALAHVMAAVRYQETGDLTAAQRHVDAARRLWPDYATLGNLGFFYTRANDWQRAIEAIRAAHELRPESPKLAHQLAQLLITHERSNPNSVATAIELAEQAVEATRKENPRYHRTLAVAYAAASRLDDALRTIQAGRARAARGSELELWFAEYAARYREALERRN